MLKKSNVWLLSLAMVIYYTMGWVIEGEDVADWQYITFWILSFSVAPILSLIIALNAKSGHQLIHIFAWSVFAIFTAELIETAWCRIPNNEQCENSYFSTIIMAAVVVNGLYALSRMASNESGKLATGIGLGIALGKTVFTKIWWIKIFKFFFLW